MINYLYYDTRSEKIVQVRILESRIPCPLIAVARERQNLAKILANHLDRSCEGATRWHSQRGLGNIGKQLG